MNKKIAAVWLIGSFVIALGFFLAISQGASEIPLTEVMNGIIMKDSSLNSQLIRQVRVPRAMACVLVGGLLGMGGAMMQGITGNPVTEPSIMGMTQGAAFAIAVVTVFGSISGISGMFTAALLGSFLSGAFVFLFSLKRSAGMHLSRLILAGTALSMFFLSAASILALLGNRSQELAFWISGGFQRVNQSQMNLLFFISIISFVGAVFLAPKINIVSLGDETAIGLGVKPSQIRIFVLLYLIPMCAVSVAVAGNIAFVGLIVPHIARRLAGSNYRMLIPLSFFLGSGILIWADIGAKMINRPYETPIGLFTTLLGAPVFLILIRREYKNE